MAAAAYPLRSVAADESGRQQKTHAAGQTRAIPHYSLLPAGTVKPQGWIYEQMAVDLEKGLAGHYNEIEPHVTKNVFVTKHMKVAAARKSVDDLTSPTNWWLGEQEGYWKDAVIRLAFLTGNKQWIDQSHEWVQAIVDAQGKDGYIGIYDKAARFQQVAGTDAELWTQARIFQAMLGYYEFTRDQRVLRAVERAVQLTLRSYPKTYFCRPGKAVNGGLTHGVGYGDTLEYLYRLTGREVYAKALVWLYADFCKAFPGDDIAIVQLLNPGLDWTEHAPHTVEAIPLPYYSHVLSGDELMGVAARNGLEKWRRCTTPGGGIVGDAVEHVGRLYGTGATYCEYCGITEGLIAANRILAWSGDLSLGDLAERRSLNAAQGARTQPVNIAVAYLSRDNQNTTDQRRKIGDRILYSARHVASCCALNSMRLMPYYVEGMWLRQNEEPGLLANLYGPCQLETTISGTLVKIKEETTYPFEDSVTFKIDPARPVGFSLQFRVPENVRAVNVSAGADAKVEKRAGLIVIKKEWKPEDMVTLNFQCDVRWATAHDNEYYYLRGPLVYGIKFPQKMVVRHEILFNGKDSGFFQYLNLPVNTTGWNYKIKDSNEEDYGFKVVQQAGEDARYPWAHSPIALVGKMLNSEGKEVDVTLVPMGNTNLRRVTFPKGGEDDISIHDSVPWEDCEA